MIDRNMLLELKQVGIRFGGLRAVQDLDLGVEAGQLYGLIGPNGAGKTTVFNLITGIYAPTEGDIRLAGASIVGLGPVGVATAGIARTFQNILGADELSYGLRRRLEIARALATRPKLLLLDEPAAGMNPSEAHDLMHLIRWVRDTFSVTILLIEHHMPVVMGICERICVLDHGAQIAVGTPKEIRDNPVVIEAYLGAEASA